MIFFGTKGKVVAGDQMQGVQCPSCQNGQLVSFGILNYFHLYWIPTFLTSKKVGMECTHCKRTLVGDEVPSHLAEQIKDGVFTVAKTLPMYSGLIIIVLVGLGIANAVRQDSAREETYLAQPAVDDYYIVDFAEIFTEVDPEYHYGVMRITDVTSTDVEMQISTVAYNMASGVRQDIRDGKAAEDSYYEQGSVRFEFGELQAYADAGAVQSIERD